MPPLALCAVADDDHAPGVVATGRRLESAGAFTARFVHVARFGLATATQASGALAGMNATLRTAAGEPPAPPFAAGLGIPEERLEIVAGDPVAELRRRAERMGAALLVVGSRRRGVLRSALAGSVQRALVANSSLPVLVVSPVSHVDGEDGPVVCGVGRSTVDARRIARAAAGFARRLERPLVLATIVDGGRHGRVLARASALAGHASLEEESKLAAARVGRVAAWLDVPSGVRGSVRVGSPPAQLAELAEVEDAALVVVGCRGGGVLGPLLGRSVSQQLVRETPRTVMLVPPRWGSDEASSQAA